MITPTVGRSLHYHPHEADTLVMPCTVGEPLACILAGVQSPTHVNLAVFDSNGGAHSCTSVRLYQEDEDVPADGGYAAWMPYQNAKVKKEANIEESKEMIKSITKR